MVHLNGGLSSLYVQFLKEYQFLSVHCKVRLIKSWYFFSVVVILFLVVLKQKSSLNFPSLSVSFRIMHSLCSPLNETKSCGCMCCMYI